MTFIVQGPIVVLSRADSIIATLGTSRETSAFVRDAIALAWQEDRAEHYPHAQEILLTFPIYFRVFEAFISQGYPSSFDTIVMGLKEMAGPHLMGLKSGYLS